MAAFWLKVIASDHVFYNGNCESLVVPAHDGEVGILPHREAMILAIQEGELRFRVPGENQYREAVSYTHLDVYKRQMYWSCLSGRCRCACDCLEMCLAQ